MVFAFPQVPEVAVVVVVYDCVSVCAVAMSDLGSGDEGSSSQSEYRPLAVAQKSRSRGRAAGEGPGRRVRPPGRPVDVCPTDRRRDKMA